MVQRWVLYDPLLDEDWAFPVNPNQMTTPHAPRSLTVLTTAPTATPATAGRVIEGNIEPYEWSFNGFIRTQDHHDELYRWCRKVNRLTLTDHLARTWLIRMIAFEPDEKRPTGRSEWRFDYRVRAINYGLAS